MELPTYTSIYRFERRLYKIFDWELPRPVSLFQAAAFVAALAALWLLGGLVGLSPGRATGWLYVMAPAVAAWAASTPIADAKRPHELIVSRTRYLLQPRRLHRLIDEREPARLTLKAVVATSRTKA